MKCKDEAIHISKGVGTAYPCQNKAWKDGYCKVHHPDYQKERENKNWQRWEKKWAEERLQKSQTVAGEDYVEARKQAGLLTFDEARQLGAKI